MKKSVKIVMVMLALTVIFAGYVYALPVAVGNLVTYVSVDSNYKGHYLFNNVTRETSFATFCLEKNEYIAPGVEYNVADISLFAYAGGIGYDSTESESNATRDKISGETQWLYSNFLGNTLSVSFDSATVSDFNDSAGISALQDAFWYLENEITSVTGLADVLVSAARTALTYSDVDLGYVRVMNIVTSKCIYKQSQLIGEIPSGGETPVPEPATLILLGSGLAGLAFYRRKKK